MKNIRRRLRTSAWLIMCHILEMRFFGGLSAFESAEVLGVSPVTVMRDWRTAAKAWLYQELSSGGSHD